MGNIIDRRNWLKQTTLAIGGLSIAPSIAARSNYFKIPPEAIRLHANENPYGPSPLARKAMADAISSSNCYPWEVTTSLREKIAAKYGLTKDNVMMGGRLI